MKISVKRRWMILAPSQQASFVNDEEKISVIYWRLPGRFCTKSSLSMRWCGKQEVKRPCQRTTPHHRTSFEWRGSSQRWWARYVKIFSKATQPQGNFAKDPSTLLKSNYVNYSTFSGFWKSDFSCFCSIWPRVSFLMV